jgi:hypothetical protein
MWWGWGGWGGDGVDGVGAIDEVVGMEVDGMEAAFRDCWSPSRTLVASSRIGEVSLPQHTPLKAPDQSD